jgi:hypothetical protein
MKSRQERPERDPPSSIRQLLSSLLISLLPLCVVLSAAPQLDAQVVFTLHSAEGTPQSGPLQELGEDGSVRLAGPKPVHCEGSQALELRRSGHSLPPPPGGNQLIFANGDRVAADVLQLDGENVQFQLTGTQEKAPLSALAVLWLNPLNDTDDLEKLQKRLTRETRAHDVVYLCNGDIVEGVLAGLTREEVQVDVDGKTLTLRRAKVAAIALSTELATTLRPEGPYIRLVLANGSRLSLARAVCTPENGLTATTLFGAKLTFPLDEVVALYRYQGRAAYLSDLKPQRYENIPYLGAPRPPGMDTSADGGDLRLAGSTYDKGLGLRSVSRLTYDLAGGYRRFEARVGLDTRSLRGSSVRVQVLLDGKPCDLGKSDELTGQGPPLTLALDVTGARQLTLVVEPGQRGGVGALVDWADARLVK